jgi:hypothetical protein
LQKGRRRSLASLRDDRYLVETQRERSGEPQRYHFSIYPECCCGSPLLSLKFYPKIPVIPNSDKSELAEIWRNEGSPSQCRNLNKKDVYKDYRGRGGAMEK